MGWVVWGGAGWEELGRDGVVCQGLEGEDGT